MNTSQGGASPELPSKVVVATVSPHNKAVYEAGKKLLMDSIDVGRDFCKSMITISTGAIPIYLAMLKLVGVESTKNTPHVPYFGLLCAAPCFLFLISSIVFILGYFPNTGNFSLDVIQEIDTARKKLIQKRMNYIIAGTCSFTVAVAASFVIIIIIM